MNKNNIFHSERSSLGIKSCKLQKTSYTAGVRVLGGKHEILEEFVSKDAFPWRHLRPLGCATATKRDAARRVSTLSGERDD